MKTKIVAIIIVVIMLFCGEVNAEDYQKGELIPVNTFATVKTDIFTYQNFMYKVDNNNSKASVSFESILNNTNEKQLVRINLLLFDSNKKNIGFITYCSSKDFSSDYTDFTISSSSSSPFSIDVSNRYMVDNNPNNVKFIAVYDDNRYCHIGGYDKYAGMSIEDIMQESLPKHSNQLSVDPSLMVKIAVVVVIVFIVISIISLLFRLIRKKRANSISKRVNQMRQEEEEKKEPVLDLSYNQSNNSSNDSLLNDEISTGGLNNNSNEVTNNENKNDGESDLTKFFQ